MLNKMTSEDLKKVREQFKDKIIQKSTHLLTETMDKIVKRTDLLTKMMDKIVISTTAEIDKQIVSLPNDLSPKTKESRVTEIFEEAAKKQESLFKQAEQDAFNTVIYTGEFQEAKEKAVEKNLSPTKENELIKEIMTKAYETREILLKAQNEKEKDE